MLRPLLITITVVLALAAPAAASTATERADATLDRALDRLVASADGPPGAEAVVQRGGETTWHAAGVADLRTRRKIQAHDRMRIASTAKAYSGAVALSLVAAGRLALTDTIARRLPALPRQWGQVTLAQLLSHTGGLPDFSESPAFVRYLSANLRRTYDSALLWTWVKDEPLQFAPGTRYRYSNTDNVLVALMAEAATGRSYETLLRQRVAGPLGLRGTSLPSTFRMPRPYITGYAPDPPSPLEDVTEALSPSYTWASGGMVSTPADMNAFARGYIGARLFPRAVQRQQFRFRAGTSEPPGPGVNSAGLAVFRYRTRCGTVYGHTGNYPGYTQFFAATLDGRRSVQVSMNLQASQTRLVPTWRLLRAAEEHAVCAALAR